MVYRGKCTLISKWTQHLNKTPIDSTVFMVKIVYKKNYFFKNYDGILRILHTEIITIYFYYKCHSLQKVEPSENTQTAFQEQT